MVVTPPDLPIARYTIRAAQRVLDTDIRMHIYCNGLSDLEELAIMSWLRSEYVTTSTNRDHINRRQMASEIGEYFQLAGTESTDFREGLYESCGEVWSREPLKISSPLVGLLDADCEIWGNRQLRDCISMFNNNSLLAVVSSDFSEEQVVFDSYSETRALLTARYHTWFSIYRRSALEVMCDFTYREEDCAGLVRKFDHGAYLQHFLFLQGWHGGVMREASRQTYLHYGAFAKNKSLNGGRLFLYRFLRIGRHNGYGHVRWIAAMPWLPQTLRGIAAICYGLLGLSAYDKERQRYNFT